MIKKTKSSVAFSILILTGSLIAICQADFVQPDLLATDSGEFNTTKFVVGNLIGEAVSGATTIDGTSNNDGEMYATTASASNNLPITITMDFTAATDFSTFYLWNSARASDTVSADNGIKDFTLTFYDAAGGTGNPIGAVYTGVATRVIPAGTANAAQVFHFPSTYSGVRSVKLTATTSHQSGSNQWTGIRELGFDGISTPSSILSYASSAATVQRPSVATLSWELTGTITSVEIQPDIGDVSSLTTNGVGSIDVSPIGHKTYTLTVNGTDQQEIEVIGLPERNKVHIYLFVGQSNMEGYGRPRDAVLDLPVPKILQFGSRDGMESTWALADHALAFLTGGGTKTGMGIEFGKTILAAQSDPDVVIGIINHGKSSSAIQWWAPGVASSKQNNPITGDAYMLYDEAMQRVSDASSFGVIKGVLWHQGEYNANNNTNPSSEPALYAGRLQSLVSNLRTSTGVKELPFICGKFVPTYNGFTDRVTVEAALEDLPNHRSNTFCVDNAGLQGISGEEIHFDSSSQRLLGQRYANAMLNFYSNPYLLYMGGYYTPTEMAVSQTADPDGDNDGDGVSNFFEYAFLTNPNSAEASAPYVGSVVNVSGVGDFPAITFRRRTDTEAPEYVIEVTQDLETWSRNTSGQPDILVEVSTPVDNGDGTENVTIRSITPIDSVNSRWFFRIEVN